MKVISIVAVFLFLSSCTYTFKSVRFDNIKNVHIATVVNKTKDYTLPQLYTESMTRIFQSDNNFTVVRDPLTADAVLTTTIIDYTRQTLSTDSQGTATSFKIIIVLAYDFRRVKDDEVLDENLSYTYEQVYSFDKNISDEAIKGDIVRKMVEELKSLIVEGF